jgi:hypothetical protein
LYQRRGYHFLIVVYDIIPAPGGVFLTDLELLFGGLLVLSVTGIASIAYGVVVWGYGVIPPEQKSLPF